MNAKQTADEQWQFFVENREAVIAALARGECDAILPAARGFMDGFANYLLDHAVIDLLMQFPDPRSRRSIPAIFFCDSLLYRPLFKLDSLRQIGAVLFRSPFVLRQLGFNARQIDSGFYASAGRTPFDEEALADFFAAVPTEDLQAYNQKIAVTLVSEFPELRTSGRWAMDTVYFKTPPGPHDQTGHMYKACVLGVWQPDVVWPVLWSFASTDMADITMGRALLDQAQSILPAGTIQHLLVDRGFLDGAWFSALWQEGTRVTCNLRSDMDAFADLVGLSQMKDTVWQRVPPPDNHRTPPPRRTIALYTGLTSWSSCTVPLSGCVIRDLYPQGTEYQATIQTGQATLAQEIYEGRGQRWDVEETFMSLTRYWAFDQLPACRPGVARALVLFAFLAFTLLGLYRRCDSQDSKEPAHPWGPPLLPMPEREVAVYAGLHYTILRPSELVHIILDNVDAWQANRQAILNNLREAENRSRQSDRAP
jgi:hypothetical protein